MSHRSCKHAFEVFLPLLITLIPPVIAASPPPPGTINAAPTPSYIDELQALAKLRDQGVITEQEFEAKKAKILGLDSPQAKPTPEPLTEEALLKKHCEQVLQNVVRSPASTKINSSLVTDSAQLEADRQRFMPNDPPIPPGKTVMIEFDSANSYGALIRGIIYCHYGKPYFTDYHVNFAGGYIDGRPIADLPRIMAEGAMVADLVNFQAQQRARASAQPSPSTAPQTTSTTPNRPHPPDPLTGLPIAVGDTVDASVARALGPPDETIHKSSGLTVYKWHRSGHTITALNDRIAFIE